MSQLAEQLSPPNSAGSAFEDEANAVTAAAAAAASQARTEVVSRVLVINTGGTIGMKDSEHGYIPIPGFLASIVRDLSILNDKSYALHHLQQSHDTGCVTPVLRLTPQMHRRIYYEFLEYAPLLDSSCMDMRSWSRIADDICRFYDKYDGFLIIHGTDTMTYTASALSFMLENLGKSVVITGAQLPLEAMNSDGIANFSGALSVAGCFVIPEVTIYFSDRLYRGNRTTKMTAFSFDAFKSPNYPPLMELGAGVIERRELIHRPTEIERFRVSGALDPNVCVIRIFPGITAQALRAFLAPPMRGAVLQTYGAGNAPDDRPELFEPFREATARGCLIINCTQCIHGNVTDSYKTGRMLYETGILPGADMTPECALTKLAYVIGLNVAPDQARSLLIRNLRGELTTAGTPTRDARAKGNAFLRSIAGAMGANEEYEQIRTALQPLLMCTAANRGDLVWLKELHDEGLDCNSSDYDGRTPLHLASSNGHRGVVDFLLRAGAYVHAKDRFNWTPLRDAVQAQQLEIIELLRQAGAHLGLPSYELAACLASAVVGKPNTVHLWLAAGADVNVPDYYGRTPLHVAASIGNMDLIELFCQSGARTTLFDNDNNTPYSLAVEAGHEEAADLIAKFAALAAPTGESSGVSGSELHELTTRRTKIMRHLCRNSPSPTRSISNSPSPTAPRRVLTRRQSEPNMTLVQHTELGQRKSSAKGPRS